MKTYLTILLTILSIGMSFKYLYQPESLLIEDKVIIQPIIENEGAELSSQYIRTIKVYYRDLHYCTDQTTLSLIGCNDSITLHSTTRMSCQILAVFNFSKKDSEWIKHNEIEYIGIFNNVTDNYYIYKNPDQSYLKNLLLIYNKTY